MEINSSTSLRPEGYTVSGGLRATSLSLDSSAATPVSVLDFESFEDCVSCLKYVGDVSATSCGCLSFSSSNIFVSKTISNWSGNSARCKSRLVVPSLQRVSAVPQRGKTANVSSQIRTGMQETRTEVEMNKPRQERVLLRRSQRLGDQFLFGRCYTILSTPTR